MKIYYSIAEILTDKQIKTDIWTRLSKCSKPIVMYGTGNGADKILTVFEARGIDVADFFASDGFVRNRCFHGKTVLSYNDITKKYSDFIIVVGFGSRLPSVLDNIYDLANKHELYMPDVPVVSDSNIFDFSFFCEHIDELSAACDLLSDKLSKQTFVDVVLFRLTGNIEFLRRHTVKPSDVMQGILGAESFVNTADLGAYNGDSIRELSCFAGNLKKVCAFEPDPKNYRKLTDYARGESFLIDAHNYAAWNEDRILSFVSGANRNSTLISDDGIKSGAKFKEVEGRKLDSVYTGDCDYIKYDVEGAEYEAILGSLNTIKRTHPKLLVSLYHRNEDLYRLPLLLKELGYKKLYLRRYEYVPAWDLNLIATE